MKYDEIKIHKDGDKLTITFLDKGKKLFTYYHDLPDGDTLSLKNINGIVNSMTSNRN